MTDENAGQTCYRHPGRPAFIQCQRCSRYICPEDMREASVGFQCPECVKQGQAAVRQPRTLAGGAISTNAGAVTMVIIGLNVLAQLIVMVTGGTRGWFFQDGAMLGLGVYDGEVHGVAHGEYWRLVTAAFLHGGLLHLAFNMYALYLFGPFVEQTLGRVRFVLTYLTLAVGSSVLVYLLTDFRTLTIGASGAVFGLFGLALVFLVRTRQNITGMLILLAINGLISLQSGISWQGHLGGFLTGLVLGLMFAYAPRERRTLAQVATFVVLWAAFVAAVAWRTNDLAGRFMILS
ncbi:MULTISPECIES: rhomboid family intramembrane serine protease [unclassified Aeromicrobium]|uniref:rhomboid family intramembrane serine protease n=1 Tax=unclassified Aeromicrobium TaxID=2633570 RepID=UPI00396AF590